MDASCFRYPVEIDLQHVFFFILNSNTICITSELNTVENKNIPPYLYTCMYRLLPYCKGSSAEL